MSVGASLRCRSSQCGLTVYDCSSSPLAVRSLLRSLAAGFASQLARCGLLLDSFTALYRHTVARLAPPPPSLPPPHSAPSLRHVELRQERGPEEMERGGRQEHGDVQRRSRDDGQGPPESVRHYHSDTDTRQRHATSLSPHLDSGFARARSVALAHSFTHLLTPSLTHPVVVLRCAAMCCVSLAQSPT